MPIAITIPDDKACIAASRNEAAFDRSTPIGWLFIVGLFVFLLIAAGVKGLVIFVLILAALGVFWLFASAAKEAREAGAIHSDGNLSRNYLSDVDCCYSTREAALSQQEGK